MLPKVASLFPSSLLCLENSQQCKEQVHYVEIKRDCSRYVLIIAKTLDQVVSVIYDEGGE